MTSVGELPGRNARRESAKSWLLRCGFNFYPSFRRTGARVTFLSHDLRTLRVRLPLNWRTCNPAGTLFGGSLYAATDALYATLLYLALGKNYIVWDKAATIRYKKPGRCTLYAECNLADAEIAFIEAELERSPSIERVYEVALTDAEGTVHTAVKKTLYIARKDAYKLKLQQAAASEKRCGEMAS